MELRFDAVLYFKLVTKILRWALSNVYADSIWPWAADFPPLIYKKTPDIGVRLIWRKTLGQLRGKREFRTVIVAAKILKESSSDERCVENRISNHSWVLVAHKHDKCDVSSKSNMAKYFYCSS